MNSKEVIKKCIKAKGIGEIELATGLKEQSIRNWVDSSRVDPLCRVQQLIDGSGSLLPLAWLCEQNNGMFINNPKVTATNKPNMSIISNSLKEFSDVISVISESLEDCKITKDEAEKIRKEWEELKIILEQFTLECEIIS